MGCGASTPPTKAEFKGHTPLTKAIVQNDVAAAKKAVAEGSDVNTCPQGTEVPPIMLAVDGGDKKEMLEFLIEKKADVNKCGPFKMTALWDCAAHRRVQSAGILLAAKADVNLESKGKSPLNIATRQNASTELINMLIAANSDINNESPEGHTPVINATVACNREVVGKLLDLKADVSGPKNFVCAAHQFATFKSAEHKEGCEILRLLLEKKADPNYQKAEGKNIGLPSLHIIASGHGAKEMIDPLIAAKANINLGLDTAKGFTPLHSAAHAGNLDVVKILVEKKADLTVKTADEELTPLMVATKAAHDEVSKYLESQGAH